MNARRIFMSCMVTALVAVGTGLGLGKVIAAEPGPSDVDQKMQVLTRGPVHEAFAETVTFDPEPGIVVAKAPPAAIEEVPPEHKPEGANVTWIPGYWGWDDERNDFLWISGIWRALPPDRQWVAGYWSQSTDGHQWTSGFWSDAQASDVEYLPEPPQTVEAGPNVDPPSADQTWIPGCWVWQQSRYAWQPGYWAAAQADWVWIPSYYVWAPRGYVFVDGYWDYSIGRRGVLFAPVYFNSGVYAQPGFNYSPATVINLAVFADQLFLRPQYSHYYFGDFYAANYRSAGFHPSFSFQSSRSGYDPIYAHQRWQHRQDRAWEQNTQAEFQRRRDHEDARPPRTFAAQTALGTSGVKSNERRFATAATLDQLTKSKDGPMHFQPVDKQDRLKYAQHNQAIQKFREQRQHLETTQADLSARKTFAQSGPAKVTLPKSFIVAKQPAEFGKGQGPPIRHEVLKPNFQIEPKQRVPVGSPQPAQGAPRLNKVEPKLAPPKAESKPNHGEQQGESKGKPKK